MPDTPDQRTNTAAPAMPITPIARETAAFPRDGAWAAGLRSAMRQKLSRTHRAPPCGDGSNSRDPCTVAILIWLTPLSYTYRRSEGSVYASERLERVTAMLVP